MTAHTAGAPARTASARDRQIVKQARTASARDRQIVTPARIAATLAAILMTLAAVAWFGASAAFAATGSVTIRTSFENTPISLNTSDAIGYALTNTTGSTQTVTFTDTLPVGVTLDNPIAATDTAGSGSCTLTPPTANPGDAAVTVTVGVPSASGTVCTISFAVVAGTPSGDVPVSDSFSGVSTTSGIVPSTTPGSLIVLANPVLSFTAPTAGQSFYFGELATATFSCATADPLDAINSFFGTDDEGNQIQSGAPIDTVDPGTRTLEVDCYSAAGGGAVSQTITYTVGSYTLSAVRTAKKTDFVSFKTLVPPGRIIAKVIYGRKVLGTTSLTVPARQTASVTIKPTPVGRKLLAAVRARTVNVRLQVSFNPQPVGTGDGQISPASATVVTKSIKLPIAHPARRAKRTRAAKHGRSRRHAPRPRG